MTDSSTGRGAGPEAREGAREAAQDAARDSAPADAAARTDADFAAMVEDQKLRRERLRHVQEFLSSPAFLDLRDAPVTVSDPPGDLQARRRDLAYRITVLEAVLALLIEEQDMLERVLSDAAPEAGPERPAAPGEESQGG